ncbi:MAG: hypothetical protein V4719_05945 [Planctomycetota bacterium]
MTKFEDSEPVQPVPENAAFNEDELDFSEMTPHELFLASLPALMRLWDTPEENLAWADL